MALQVGDADCNDGLARRLYDARAATITLPPAGDLRDACVASLKADCFAIAGAVVAEITANGAPRFVVGAGVAGLQTSTAVDAPTGAPATPVILTGTIS
jgi:hypothetical protein